MRDPRVFGHPEMRSDEMVPSRAEVLEHIDGVLSRLGRPSPYSVDEKRRGLCLVVYSAVFENKLTTAEAAEWNDRIDRRYEEVTGQPAPPRPPDPFAEEA